MISRGTNKTKITKFFSKQLKPYKKYLEDKTFNQFILGCSRKGAVTTEIDLEFTKIISWSENHF